MRIAGSSEGDPDGLDLNKTPVLGCILIPILIVVLVVTVLGFLGAAGVIFAALPQLLSLCIPPEGLGPLNSAMRYTPALFGAVIVAALVASFARPAGLWFRILMIPLGLACLALLAFFWLARRGYCTGLSPA